jgi:hypothetical protein
MKEVDLVKKYLKNIHTIKNQIAILHQTMNDHLLIVTTLTTAQTIQNQELIQIYSKVFQVRKIVMNIKINKYYISVLIVNANAFVLSVLFMVSQ